MWKRAWATYSEIITLDCLLRLNPRTRVRVLGLIALLISLLLAYGGWSSLQPGVVGTTKGGAPGSREATVFEGITILFVAICLLFGAVCALIERDPLVELSRLPLYLRPIAYGRFAHEFRRTDDTWLSTRCGAAHRLIGLGSYRPPQWYLTGKSTILAGSLDGVCDFLMRCRYVSDREQFDCADFWQHPMEFEKSMRGDCEDYALWAWRKLKDLGMDAEFVCGRCSAEARSNDHAGHAWVILRHHGETFLIETTAHSKQRMVRPLDTARSSYVPHFSFDRDCRVSVYGGYLESCEAGKQ